MFLALLLVTCSHPCLIIRVHRPIIGSFINRPRIGFLAATIRSSTYYSRDRAGLDTSLDFPRGAAHLARLARALGPRRQRARARGHSRRAPQVLCVHFILVLVSILTAPHHRAGSPSTLHQPSTEPLPATSSALQDTILPSGPETFTHNMTTIIACTTKADLIGDNTDRRRRIWDRGWVVW